MPTPVDRDHVLPDGTLVRLRDIRTDDRQRLLAMWERTSETSRRNRFHGTFRLTDDNVGRFTDLDPALQRAVVATLGRGEDERIVGVARYERDPDAPRHAEFAALVEDAHQGRGIGTALMRALAESAKDDGVAQLTGDVLAGNARMLRLIEELGLSHSESRSQGFDPVVRSDLELDFSPEFLRVVAEDERQAATAAVRRFLAPERVAVVGASRDPTSIGGLVFSNLVRGGFSGVAYPVNSASPYVQGVTAYPSVADCPEIPDVVVVCVPAPDVAGVLDDAGKAGCRAAVVISAGFAETGPDGASLQDDAIAAARAHGMRLVGPNCMGVLNGADDVRMNATFATTFPRAGRVSMSSQSGALGLAVLDHVAELGLGISTFVSVGNKVDISGNDLLLAWEQHDATDVVLLYLESFGNPRKFSRIARRLSRRKPIVAVKSGRTAAGVRAASSHTAALSTGDVAVDALFAQTGVIRTDTLEEMFAVATVLSGQPLPRGRRIGILTNAGGPGILATDACESEGLEVVPLGEQTRARLAEFLSDAAGTGNPVDMIAGAGADEYARALTVLGESGEVDVLLAIFIPTATTSTDDVTAALAAAREDLPDDVPLVGVVMSRARVPATLAAAGIPSFTFPEDAARALGRVGRYARWRERPLGEVVRPDDIDEEAARAVVDDALVEAGRTWLGSQDTLQVLRAYGIPTAASHVVRSARGAARAARTIEGPVAVKIAAPIHKTDIGGVVLDVRGQDAVRDAVQELDRRLEEADLAEHQGRYLVQEMVTDGIEMLVGVTTDPSFGPLITTGLGGTLVELVGDVAVRVTPITDRDVEEMLAQLRMRPLLDGYRGAPPADVAALRDVLHRVGALVEDLPEVVELDLNPVLVRPEGQGVRIVDARIEVAAAAGG